jgi:hypothetical protein
MEALFGKMFFESLPYTLSLLAICHHTVGLVGKQRQLLTLSQQELRLLVKEETVEHGSQQPIKRIIKHIDYHIPIIINRGILAHRTFSPAKILLSF